MIAYILSRLFEMDGRLSLMTGNLKDPCALRMTASKPKKVSRSIDLELDPEDLFLMYQAEDGRILWRKPVILSRDASGALYFNITDILRSEGIPFNFCPTARLRHYKARMYDLRDSLSLYDWGFWKARDGYALESTAGATLNFFPGSCQICGAEVYQITLSGFGWESNKLREYIKEMQSPVRIDAQTACRCLEEQGPLAKLFVTAGHVSVAVHMFFLTSFEVEAFGRKQTFHIHNSMFRNGTAPCDTARFGPLLCRFLEAADEAALEEAIRWGMDQQILEA